MLTSFDESMTTNQNHIGHNTSQIFEKEIDNRFDNRFFIRGVYVIYDIWYVIYERMPSKASASEFHSLICYRLPVCEICRHVMSRRCYQSGKFWQLKWINLISCRTLSKWNKFVYIWCQTQTREHFYWMIMTWCSALTNMYTNSWV